MVINFVSGERILTALTAADLMPCATVRETHVEADRLWLSSRDEAYGIVARDHRYDVVDHASRPVFGLRDVGLETAFRGAVELLAQTEGLRWADLSSLEDRIGLDGRAVELSHTGICSVRVRGDSLVIRHCAEPDHVAIATRVVGRPWLWEVASGDLGSDACPVPVLCGWEQLRELALDGAI